MSGNFPPIHHLCVCGSQWNVADSGASTQVLVISVLDVPLRGYLTSLGQHRSNETEKGLLLRAHSQKYSYSKGPSLERFSLPSRWAHWKSQFKARPCTHVCTRTLMLESRVLTPVRRHYWQRKPLKWGTLGHQIRSETWTISKPGYEKLSWVLQINGGAHDMEQQAGELISREWPTASPHPL